MKTICDIPAGGSARVEKLMGEGAVRRRLLDMGITPKTLISVTKVAPMGDPIELSLRGYTLTIRLEDAEKIIISEEQA